jgi:inner membrane protein
MGVNAPDVDVFAGFLGEFQSTALRRGWTHGVLALVLWPFVLTGVLLAWDRWVRLRRKPEAAPARAGPLLALTALAVLTHPTLDWLNNYGLRWLMPFDGRWFYGDALFVIDPWFWLCMGGAALLTFSQSRLAQIRWTVFFALATVVIFVNTRLVPLPSAVLWLVGIAALVALRWRLRNASPAMRERAAQAGIAVASLYVVAMVGASAAARSELRAVAEERGIDALDVMVAPTPANPFDADVVVMTRDTYHVGRFDWLANPRVTFDAEQISRPSGPEFEAAARTTAARRFLVWSRYPAVDVETAPDGGALVHFFDVRYHSFDRLTGPSVELPAGAPPSGGD